MLGTYLYPTLPPRHPHQGLFGFEQLGQLITVTGVMPSDVVIIIITIIIIITVMSPDVVIAPETADTGHCGRISICLLYTSPSPRDS